MWKYITSFFKSLPEEDLSLDEAYKILDDTEDEISPEAVAAELDDSYSCYNKSGVVTSMKDGICIIDDTYKFKTDLKNLDVGVGVTFTAYITNGKVNVTNIALKDDWQIENNNKTSWCHRNLICTVFKRVGRNIYVTPGDLCIDLNTAIIEFIPIVGDWLEINAKVELNEHVSDLSGNVLEIEKIYPLRPRIVEGRINRWDNIKKVGLIDQNIFFNGDSLMSGYIPRKGDKIVTEIIESDQNKCCYRSLKVLPETLVHKQIQIVDDRLPKFELGNDEVCISNDILLEGQVLCEERHFIFTVINQSQKDLELLSISVPLNNSECVIKDSKYIVISPSQMINVEGCCKSKSVGKTRTLVLFSFANFKIGRWIVINLQLNHNDYINMDTSRKIRDVDLTLSTTYFKNDNTFLVKGRKKYSSPNFIYRNMSPFEIPKILLNLVYKNYINKEDLQLKAALQTNKPSLNEQLIFNNYEERFHTLLYLEEIETLIHMRTYDQKTASFIKNGEYLMLEIENLSEKRPSLILGDVVRAKDSYDQDAMEYEGIIDNVDAKHIYVKFAQQFHDSYDGEDMSVIMIRSRFQFRKMHYGVGLAVKNLGPQILFPNKIAIKNPQISFSETECNNKDANSNCKRLKLEWYNTSLNYQQKEAVKNILLGEAKPLPYIIFGPPGTGKTVTLVETILQLLRLIPHSRLLVATPSNSAANLIAIRLINSGVLKPGDLIRLVGHNYLLQDKLPIELIPYSAFIDIAISGTTRQISSIYKSNLILSQNSSVIGRHRITIGTCTILGSLNLMEFPQGHFTHIIVDEAGQAIEPLIMLSLNMVDTSSGQIILAGDPLQLGPIVFSQLAINYGLTETYLERIINRFPYVRDINGFPDTNGYDPRLITKLVHNYRSLPDILALSSKLYYDNDLIPTISSNDSDLAQLLDKIKEILPKRTDLKNPQVVFHGVIGDSYKSLDCPSWFNPNEVSQIFYYINEFYRLGLKSTDIGVISPYIKQAKQIRELLVEAEFNVPKVGSVEDFQGQEFNIILISTVRSNETTIHKEVRQQIGFISNSKRVNVAITRAQALMIIIGNPHLLAQDSNWQYIIQYCIERGAYCGCDLKKF